MKFSQPLQKQLNVMAVVPNEEFEFKCCLRRYVTSAHSLRSLKKQISTISFCLMILSILATFC
jgi:hypothetical protein